jgi:transposase InsO family protein
LVRDILVDKKLSKSAMARHLKVSRSSLYYIPKQPKKDEAIRDLILNTLNEHPSYGHRFIALELKTGKNRVRRVMLKYGIKPRIGYRKPKYGSKTSVIAGIPNRTRGISPIAPNVIWVGDFTYLPFHGRVLYLATVMDRYTREILAWQIGLHHTTRLILDVLEEALRRRGTNPSIFHSDQGSEYTANACIEWLVKNKIHPSHSPKGKPWNNGHQESFYAKFKVLLGKPSQYETIEKLIEAVGGKIHYYNTRRMHSALKMPPRVFYEKEIERSKLQTKPKL